MLWYGLDMDIWYRFGCDCQDLQMRFVELVVLLYMHIMWWEWSKCSTHLWGSYIISGLYYFPLLRWWPVMFMDSNSDCSLSLLFSYLSESAKRCHPDQQGYSALALILTDLCISLHIQCINLFTSTPTAPLWNIQAILTLKQNVYTPACNGGSHAQERDPIICWSMSMHTGEEPYKLYE